MTRSGECGRRVKTRAPPSPSLPSLPTPLPPSPSSFGCPANATFLALPIDSCRRVRGGLEGELRGGAGGRGEDESLCSARRVRWATVGRYTAALWTHGQFVAYVADKKCECAREKCGQKRRETADDDACDPSTTFLPSSVSPPRRCSTVSSPRGK